MEDNFIPLYKYPSGQFTGWKNVSDNRLYNQFGLNVGFFVNNVAYFLNGQYLGEIVNGDYIGKILSKTYPPQSPKVPSIPISKIPIINRIPTSTTGWVDPDI
ncbi:MAG: hypothetical protein ACFFG0_27000 [Candidatus Thorarchaeota archaeon]